MKSKNLKAVTIMAVTMSLFASSLGQSVIQNDLIKNSKTMITTEKGMDLQPFFKAELRYIKGKEPVAVSKEGRIGKLLGSGEGKVFGDKIQGKVHWSIFEIIGTVCETNIVGIINTNDGFTINFESKGFGTVPDKSKPNLWDMPAVIKFDAESDKYKWVNKTFALWTGEFDMERGIHKYQAWYTR